MLESPTPKLAAQPFTFGGVARFASASFGRLCLIGFLFALLGGLAVGRIVSSCWYPVISEAVNALPPTGSIGGSRLQWPEKRGGLLAANQFLSIEVAIDPARKESGASDVSLELHPDRIELRTLYGSGFAPYPSFWNVEFNRPALAPWWGAWQMPVLFWFIFAAALSLMAVWALLAMIYMALPLLLGLAAGRDLNAWRAWKLAVAAQWPGAMLMSFALAFYSTGQTSVVYLTVMFAAHFVPTLCYLLVSPFLTPKKIEVGENNPFETETKIRSAKNPFASRS